MKISENLPQFNDGIALCITTGSHEADFYLAAQGMIEKIDTFTVEKTDPAIPAGFVVAESGGRKHLKKMRQADFLETFKEHLAIILKKQPIALAYLFTPAEVAKELVQTLPAALQKNLRVYEGNFHNEHPFKLLEKIKTETHF